MVMSKTAISQWTLLSMSKTIIVLNKKLFGNYAKDLLGSMKKCYVGQVLNYCHTELSEVPREMYENSR